MAFRSRDRTTFSHQLDGVEVNNDSLTESAHNKNPILKSMASMSPTNNKNGIPTTGMRQPLPTTNTGLTSNSHQNEKVAKHPKRNEIPTNEEFSQKSASFIQRLFFSSKESLSNNNNNNNTSHLQSRVKQTPSTIGLLQPINSNNNSSSSRNLLQKTHETQFDRKLQRFEKSTNSDRLLHIQNASYLPSHTTNNLSNSSDFKRLKSLSQLAESKLQPQQPSTTYTNATAGRAGRIATLEYGTSDSVIENSNRGGRTQPTDASEIPSGNSSHRLLQQGQSNSPGASMNLRGQQKVQVRIKGIPSSSQSPVHSNSKQNQQIPSNLTQQQQSLEHHPNHNNNSKLSSPFLSALQDSDIYSKSMQLQSLDSDRRSYNSMSQHQHHHQQQQSLGSSMNYTSKGRMTAATSMMGNSKPDSMNSIYQLNSTSQTTVGSMSATNYPFLEAAKSKQFFNQTTTITTRQRGQIASTSSSNNISKDNFIVKESKGKMDIVIKHDSSSKMHRVASETVMNFNKNKNNNNNDTLQSFFPRNKKSQFDPAANSDSNSSLLNLQMNPNSKNGSSRLLKKIQKDQSPTPKQYPNPQYSIQLKQTDADSYQISEREEGSSYIKKFIKINPDLLQESEKLDRIRQLRKQQIAVKKSISERNFESAIECNELL